MGALSLPVTPGRIAAGYDYLRTWPAFARCGLPPSAEVAFHVIRSKRVYGQYSQADAHAIYVSGATNGLSDTILRTIAHEMVHQVLRLQGDSKFWQHGRAFKSLARRVCASAGWDAKAF